MQYDLVLKPDFTTLSVVYLFRMKVLEFAFLVGKLKELKRTGWKRHKVPLPESVAEHSYRVAMLAMVLARQAKVDELKAIKMALVHDLAEVEVGDVIKMIGSKTLPNVEQQYDKEREAMRGISETIGKEELLSLYDEYNDTSSPVGRFVKQLDKLEVAIQAYEYETKTKIALTEFYETAREKVHDNFLKDILNEIFKLRK